MIKYMVLGPPRSGTAWAAAWLGFLHEPLAQYKFEDIPEEGISCTVMGMYPDFVNKQPAKKVILHRPYDEVNESAKRVGIGIPYSVDCYEALDRINGKHVHWRELFDNPDGIYGYLFGRLCDKERHRQLSKINIQNLKLIDKVRSMSCLVGT